MLTKFTHIKHEKNTVVGDLPAKDSKTKRKCPDENKIRYKSE